MVVHILARSIGIFVVASVCVFAVSNGINLFVWHPILMTTGVSIPNNNKKKTEISRKKNEINQILLFLYRLE